MYGMDKEFEKMAKAVRKAIKELDLYDKDLWSHADLKAVAAKAHADIVDVMFVARYCR